MLLEFFRTMISWCQRFRSERQQEASVAAFSNISRGYSSKEIYLRELREQIRKQPRTGLNDNAYKNYLEYIRKNGSEWLVFQKPLQPAGRRRQQPVFAAHAHKCSERKEEFESIELAGEAAIVSALC